MNWDKQTYLLDGGMGQELFRRGARGNEALWSANALLTAPNLVQSVHESYIEAGADIITTNTYASTRERFGRFNLNDRFVELNQLACRLAQRARENQNRPDILIAGSLPPYYGSYRPELVGPYDELLPLYQEQADVLAPYVDFFLCETMSTAEEARAAATAATETGKPVWVAWTLEDGGTDHLRSGETLVEAAGALGELAIDALLVNCCAPESITAAMPKLAAMVDLPVGGYANGFMAIPEDWLVESSVDLLGSRNDLDPTSYAEHVKKWLDAGARIVGGCCEVGPEHIAEIRKMIDANT